MWLQSSLIHYFQWNCLHTCRTCRITSHCVFSVCVLLLCHPVECVSFSLSLTASSAAAQRACVHVGFTRCWFNRWTDDRLSQQLRRQIHSPTLPLRCFTACFVCIRLSLSYSHRMNVLPAWHIGMDRLQTEPHRRYLPLGFKFSITVFFYEMKDANYDFKSAVN